MFRPPGALLGRPGAVGTGGGDVSLPRARPSCARGASLQAHSYHPSWDKQELSSEASSLDSLCASITRQCELSPWSPKKYTLRDCNLLLGYSILKTYDFTTLHLVKCASLAVHTQAINSFILSAATIASSSKRVLRNP